METPDAEGDGGFHVGGGIVDKQDLLRLNGCPFYGLSVDLGSRLLESHLVGQNPSFKGMDHGKPGGNVVKVKGVGVGDQTESYVSLQGPNDSETSAFSVKMSFQTATNSSKDICR